VRPFLGRSNSAAPHGGTAPPLSAPSWWGEVAPLALAAFLAVAVFVSSEWAYQGARSSLEGLNERSKAIVTTQQVLRRLVDAEAAQRGYLLTGRRDYLNPYRDADADVARGLAAIRAHYQDDPALSAKFDELSARAKDKLSELSTTLAEYEAGRHEAWQAILATDIGRERMEAARDAALVLVRNETERIAEDQELVFGVLERGRLGVHITTLLALIWLIFYLRKHTALQEAQRVHAQDLKEQRDTLERLVNARTEELRTLNAYLQDVREVERSKLARLLHDELGALLTAAKLDIARLRRSLGAMPQDAALRLSHLGTTIDDGVTLKRRIIEELSPSALHTLGLKAALEILVAEFRERTKIEITLDCDDIGMGDSQRIAVYRLVQECLHNIERHAGAHSAHVVVRQAESRVLMQVSDSGVGFDPQRVPGSSHGLRSLRHRIEALGGRMFTVSAPGHGTEVEANLPLAAPDWAPGDAPSPS
jgi:signal transduction histidine kinase